jgi:hypothetical protein
MRNNVALLKTSVLPLTIISPARLRGSRSRVNVGGAGEAGADPGALVADPGTVLVDPGTVVAGS